MITAEIKQIRSASAQKLVFVFNLKTRRRRKKK